MQERCAETVMPQAAFCSTVPNKDRRLHLIPTAPVQREIARVWSTSPLGEEPPNFSYAEATLAEPTPAVALDHRGGSLGADLFHPLYFGYETGAQTSSGAMVPITRRQLHEPRLCRRQLASRPAQHASDLVMSVVPGWALTALSETSKPTRSASSAARPTESTGSSPAYFIRSGD